MKDLKALIESKKINSILIAEWIIEGHNTFMLSEVCRELNLNSAQVTAAIRVLKNWGVSFDESYIASGCHGGNEKRYTFVGVGIDKKETKSESKKESLWKLALSS